MSGRSASTALKNAFAEDAIKPFLLFDLGFTGGTVYAWTGLGTISWNSNTYNGFGNTLGISEVVETTDIRAAGITIEFQALTSAYKSLALSQVSLNSSVTIRIGLLDSSGAIVADPEIVFVGKMDEVAIIESGEFSTFRLQCENRLVKLQYPNERRYTHQDQLDYKSTDTGLRHTVNSEKIVRWGSGL